MFAFFGAWAVGCGGASLPGEEPPGCWREEAALPAEAAPVWTPIADAPVLAGGLTERVSVDLPEGTAVVGLRVSDPAGAAVCVQLAQVDDGAGTSWVTSGAGDAGPHCTGCPQRVAVGVGYGLYLLPSNDRPPPPARQLGIVAAVRDCTTFLSDPPAPARLRIEGLFRPAVSPAAAGVIPLGLAFTASSPLADPDRRRAVIPEVMRALDELLAPGGLQVAVVRTRELPAEAPLALTRGDHAPLDALYQQVRGGATCAPPPDDAWIPVVFAGCIRMTDPIQGTTAHPDGLTTGIPAGFPPPGRAHGIYLKNESCLGAGPPIDWPPSLLAKLLAHELGHYLGLYHTVEEDGTTDQLADTGADNIMHPRPLEAPAQGLSPSQLAIMRRHPMIRWPALRR